MYEYSITTAEVRICYEVNGLWECQKYLLSGPGDEPPDLPDPDDPSVPPPTQGPGDDPWVPPAKPGEPEWNWGGSQPVPTREGSWWRECAPNVFEYLHWDVPHGDGFDHWMWEKCDGSILEMPIDWQQHGKYWHEPGWRP